MTDISRRRLSAESYTLDSASNLTAKTVGSLTAGYTFDAADQILGESNTGYSASCTYDDNGTTYSYIYDNGDKLDIVKNGSTTVKSYSYDAAGRTTAVTSSVGTTSLTYDYEDRVAQISMPGSATDTFTYNGYDTRVGKVDTTGTYTPGISERKSGTSTFDRADYLGTFTARITPRKPTRPPASTTRSATWSPPPARDPGQGRLVSANDATENSGEIG